jgi:hypothetical protein
VTGNSEAGAPASKGRFPSEWVAALIVVLTAGAIRLFLSPAAVTAVAVAGLAPLVVIYGTMGALLRLPMERRAGFATGGRRMALIAGLVLIHLPLPLLLVAAHPAAGGLGLSADRGLGLGLGGYFISLLEAAQLFIWLSRQGIARTSFTPYHGNSL